MKDDEAGTALLGCAAVMFGAVVLDALAVLYRGWALSVLWGWFAVPYGLPALSVASSAGVVLLLFVAVSRGSSYKGHDVDWTATLIGAVVSPLAALLTGWLLLQVA